MNAKFTVKADDFRAAVLAAIARRIDMANNMQGWLKGKRAKEREAGAIAALTDLKAFIESWEIEP